MPIETRLEVPRDADIDYAARNVSAKAVKKLKHRSFVGGRWEEMGAKQLEFLQGRGLLPEHRFLDLGCGSLRAGRLLAAYLDPGNYYGIDVNLSLLTAGYENELDEATRARLPESNLRVTDRFDSDFGVQFDMAIAQSIFSHLSLNHLRLALARVAKVMALGGKFYVTLFEQDPEFPVDGISQRGRTLYTERNFYWYYRKDLAWATEHLPWEFNYVGDWGHPRGQVMAEFVRVEGDPTPFV